jgi:branched-chain amino acid transport system ATP-binding protein
VQNRSRASDLEGAQSPNVSDCPRLALDPKLLLLDEPTDGLLPTIAPSIVDGIAWIGQLGDAVPIAESNLHHLPDFADRLCLIERGEIIFAGTPADVHKDIAVARIVTGATATVQD